MERSITGASSLKCRRCNISSSALLREASLLAVLHVFTLEETRGKDVIGRKVREREKKIELPSVGPDGRVFTRGWCTGQATKVVQS